MDYGKYLREDRLPVIWCSGCGHGTAIKALLRAIDRVGLDQDNTAVVSGIGCSSRATGYLDFNTLHTTHGRAIAFATGLKIAKPDMNVLVITGDGDATAIGGNHFIHAARRNIDLTVILLNNFIYGMTGGQASPTTPTGSKATTAPFGALDPCFDISKLAAGAGASYVARCSVHQPVQADKMMEAAIRKEGCNNDQRVVLENRRRYSGVLLHGVVRVQQENRREEKRIRGEGTGPRNPARPAGRTGPQGPDRRAQGAVSPHRAQVRARGTPVGGYRVAQKTPEG